MDEKTSTCYALKSIAYEPLIKCYTVWLGLKLAANQEKCHNLAELHWFLVIMQYTSLLVKILESCFKLNLRFDTTFCNQIAFLLHG